MNKIDIKATARYLAGALMVLLTVPALFAANDTWNGGGANGAWTNSADWGGTAPVAGDRLFFAGTTRLASSNTFAANTLFNSLTFNSGAGAFTLSGNAINLGGGITNLSLSLQTISLNMALQNNIVIDATSGDLTLSGIVSGSGFGLTKTGSGTLNMTGNSTYTGATVINGGTLASTAVDAGGFLSSSSALSLGGGTLSVAFADNGAQTFNGTTITTGSSTISTSGTKGNKRGTLTLGTITRSTGSVLDFELNNGFGTIALNNSNTNGILGAYATVNQSDWATVTGGAVAATTYTTLTTSGGSSTVNYNLTGSSTMTGSQSINTLKVDNSAANQSLNLGGTTLTLAGGGLLFVGANGYTITNGTMTVSNSGLGAYEMVIQDFGTGNLTNKAVIADNGANAVTLTKAGTGNLILAAANTFSGNTRILDGTLTLGNALALQNSTLDLNVSDNGALSFGTLTTSTLGGLTGGRSLGLTNNAGTAVGLTAGGNNGSTTYSGVLSGGGSFTKAGTGTLTLNNNNTFTGGLTLNAGTLNIANAGALGTGAFAIGGSGSFDNTTGSSLIITNAFNISGGSPTYVGTTDVTMTGAVTLSGANRTITVNNSTMTIGGVIGDAGGNRMLTKAGAGTLNLTNANTYTGGTTLSAGTLGVGNNNALGSGTVSLGNGTLTAVGGARTITNAVSITASTGTTIGGANNVTLSGVVTDTASRTLTVNNTGLTTLSSNVFLSDDNTTGSRRLTINGTGNTVISGNIANNGAGNTVAAGLTYAGSGTLTLAGNNSYSGTTIITSGTVKAQNNNSFGSTAAGTTISGSTASVQVDGNGLNIAEAATLNTNSSAGGIRNLANNNTWTGAITVGTGGGRINSDAGTLTVSGGISGGNAVSFGGAGNTTVDTTAISGTGTSVGMDGSGTLEFDTANTYTGGTTLSSGTIKLGANNALGSGSFAFAGGVLNANNFNFTVGAVTLSGTSSLQLGLGGANAVLTLASISGSGVLNIFNWAGGAGISGTDDRIIVLGTVSSAVLANINFNGYGNGATALDLGDGTFELSYVPEPTTWAMIIFVAAVLFVRFILPRLRRSLAKA